jgi:L-lactate dehydrogenase complex protein LldG
MSAREEMLSRIRARLGHDGAAGKPARPDLIDQPPLRPEVGDDLVAHFAAKAEAIAATVEVVDSAGNVPGAIASYLKEKGLALEIDTGRDRWLAGMPWGDAGIEVSIRHPREAGLTGVSRAAFAIAETGTVALNSGVDNPVTLNYLADYHIVLVEKRRVVAYQEEIWAEYRGDGMPRALCFITGPSRTGDIEFDIQLGAHGPRNLHVIIVASD